MLHWWSVKTPIKNKLRRNIHHEALLVKQSIVWNLKNWRVLVWAQDNKPEDNSSKNNYNCLFLRGLSGWNCSAETPVSSSRLHLGKGLTDSCQVLQLTEQIHCSVYRTMLQQAVQATICVLNAVQGKKMSESCCFTAKRKRGRNGCKK